MAGLFLRTNATQGQSLNFGNCTIISCINVLEKQCAFLKYTAALFLLSLLLSPLIGHASPTVKKITIAFQQTNKFSQQLIDHLVKDMHEKGYDVQQIQLQSPLNSAQFQQQHLIIALGSKVTKTLLESSINKPTLSLLIPKDFSDALEKNHPNATHWSRLLIDQPINRHFDLISAILGPHHKTGLLLGPYTQQSESLFEKAATESKQSLATYYINQTDQLSSALKSLSKEADILLALPDPGIYNKSTTRSILLSSYRYKLPIIGFSKAYVKAGAIAAIYSEPEQISTQTINISDQFFDKNNFEKKVYYPTNFSVSLNHKVARSMNIWLPESSVITEQIKKSEKRP